MSVCGDTCQVSDDEGRAEVRWTFQMWVVSVPRTEVATALGVVGAEACRSLLHVLQRVICNMCFAGSTV